MNFVNFNGKSANKGKAGDSNPLPSTEELQKQQQRHLLSQLTNDPRGNIANQDAARSFREAMDKAFITAIPNNNARFRSCIRNGLDLQQQFFNQRKKKVRLRHYRLMNLKVNFQPLPLICTYLIWAHKHTPSTWWSLAMSMACLLPFATAVDEIIMPFLKPIDAGGI